MKRTNNQRHKKDMRAALANPAPYPRRSKASNDVLFVGGDTDGRSAENRRWRDIVRDTIARASKKLDSEVVVMLARQYATTVVKMERHMSALFDGDGRDMSDADYVKLCNSANRVLRMLGMLVISDDRLGEFSGVDGLEKYCAGKKKKTANHKIDRRRERSASRVRM